MRKLNFDLISLVAVSLVTTVLTACQNADTVDAVPARIIDVNEITRAELRNAVAQLVSQQQVLIADDALTSTSVLILERQLIRDAQGNRIQGRELQPPEKIELQLSNGKCVLKHSSTGEIAELKKIKCIAL